MAIGDLKVMEMFSQHIGDGTHDLDTDTIKLMLVSDTYATVDATDATPLSTDYTEVSGTGYTAGGNDITATFVRAAKVATFDGANQSWPQDAAGPTDIRTGLVVNSSNNTIICAIDCTSDGSTPLDNTTTTLTFNWHANGIFTVTVP